MVTGSSLVYVGPMDVTYTFQRDFGLINVGLNDAKGKNLKKLLRNNEKNAMTYYDKLIFLLDLMTVKEEK